MLFLDTKACGAFPHPCTYSFIKDLLTAWPFSTKIPDKAMRNKDAKYKVLDLMAEFVFLIVI